MPRYYRRRYRTIVRAPKKKWATNIVNFNQDTAGNTAEQFGVVDLVKNSTQSSNPTPVIIKTGNFKIQGDVYVQPASTGAATEVSLYVMYVPEGITLATAASARALIMAHPEWILSWKFINANIVNSTAMDNSDSFSFSSRLKRNLNSGDSIQLVCLCYSTNMTKAVFAGMAQYWTCAN